MGQLVFGLYVEGNSDERFLLSVIERATIELLARYDRADIDILIVTTKPKKQRDQGQAEKIFAAATDACGYHLLIVHTDADGPAYADAYNERFAPGLELVKQAGKNACQDLVPVIPIQEIEAWLLADKDALLKELGVNKSVANESGMPSPRQVESIAQPKEYLENVIRKVNQSRPRRPLTSGDLYVPLGKIVSLDKPGRLSAYRRFIDDLTEALMKLDIIQPSS